jgi:cell wall-associated NlpC family hydrolase
MDGVSPPRTRRVEHLEPGETTSAFKPTATRPQQLHTGATRAAADWGPKLAKFVAAERARTEALRAVTPRTEVQRKLDAFMNRANAPYRVGDETVYVTPGFRMNEGYGPSVAQAASAISKKLPKGAVPLSTIGRVASGKGTPDRIQRVTQALIDAGALADFKADSPEQSVRQMMFHYGIGNDCSGYTYQAYASVHGTHFNPDAPPGRLVSRDAKDARPGDVMRLIAADGSTGSGTGHKVMVYSHEVRPRGAPPPRVSNRPEVPASFTNGGPVHVFELDSSWGGGENGAYGGVERHVWLFNEKTSRWAHFDSRDKHVVVSKSGPYNHKLDGVFR